MLGLALVLDFVRALVLGLAPTVALALCLPLHLREPLLFRFIWGSELLFRSLVSSCFCLRWHLRFVELLYTGLRKRAKA